MHILFDQNVPRPIRRSLPGHLIETSEQRGWARLKNGLLLQAAERAGFHLLVTADQNIQYQQNLSERVIGLIVLGSAQWPQVRQYLHQIAQAVDVAHRNSYSYIAMPLPLRKRRDASNDTVKG